MDDPLLSAMATHYLEIATNITTCQNIFIPCYITKRSTLTIKCLKFEVSEFSRLRKMNSETISILDGLDGLTSNDSMPNSLSQ